MRRLNERNKGVIFKNVCHSLTSSTQGNIKLLEQSNQVLKEQLTRTKIKQKY